MKSWKKLTGATTLVAAGLVGALVSSTGAYASTPNPGTSPGVQRTWVTSSGTDQCSSGYLCAYVDPNDGRYGEGWFLFKFVHCGVYNLSYWHDYSIVNDSFVIDDQTGNVTTTYYGGYNGTGKVWQTMKPKANDFQDVNLRGTPNGWNPISSIRVC